jgi:hypothetical protein
MHAMEWNVLERQLDRIRSAATYTDNFLLVMVQAAVLSAV